MKTSKKIGLVMMAMVMSASVFAAGNGGLRAGFPSQDREAEARRDAERKPVNARSIDHYPFGRVKSDERTDKLAGKQNNLPETKGK